MSCLTKRFLSIPMLRHVFLLSIVDQRCWNFYYVLQPMQPNSMDTVELKIGHYHRSLQLHTTENPNKTNTLASLSRKRTFYTKDSFQLRKFFDFRVKVWNLNFHTEINLECAVEASPIELTYLMCNRQQCWIKCRKCSRHCCTRRILVWCWSGWYVWCSYRW